MLTIRIWPILAVIFAAHLLIIVVPNANSICDHYVSHNMVFTECGPSQDWVTK